MDTWRSSAGIWWKATKPGWLGAVTGSRDRDMGVRSGLDTDLSSWGRNEKNNAGVQPCSLLRLSPPLPHIGEAMGWRNFLHNIVHLSEVPPCPRDHLFYSLPEHHEDFLSPLKKKAQHCTRIKQKLLKNNGKLIGMGKLIGKGAPLGSAKATMEASEGNPSEWA